LISSACRSGGFRNSEAYVRVAYADALLAGGDSDETLRTEGSDMSQAAAEIASGDERVGGGRVAPGKVQEALVWLREGLELAR